jgi:hypothetical protein
MKNRTHNSTRTAAAQLALEVYGRSSGNSSFATPLMLDEVIIDLLSDLRHFAAVHKIDFGRAVRISECHFAEEHVAVERPIKRPVTK